MLRFIILIYQEGLNTPAPVVYGRSISRVPKTWTTTWSVYTTPVDMINEVMNTKDLADMLGLQAQTIRLWRSQGRGPQYMRFDGEKSRVYYRRIDVERWLQQNSFSSTSDEAVRRAN